MNIKNQIRLSVLISLILVVVISVSIIVSYQNMQDLQRQENLAADVVRGGYELTYLSNDYLINAEPRARFQWEERYASLQPFISQLKPENKEEEQSLAIIRDHNENIRVLFREIPEPKTLSTGSVLFPSSYQQVTWSRINVQSQGMIYEAWRLRHLYSDNVSEARFWNNILVLFLMVLMLVIIGVNYLLISRRLVRSIREVNVGSEVFATGNLDYRIPVKRDDEIGGIAQRLNTMAEQIRAVTASRDELDLEITERKRVEEALNQANKKLNLLSSITRHDINNQLTLLMGFLTILKKKQPDPSLNDYFVKASNAAQRISSMIQFTREYECIGVKAPAWQDCRTVIDTAAKEAPLGKVVVKNDLPASAEVFADPLFVKVCYNLMDNAVRYGGKITTIRFSVEERDGDHLIVCEDDGDGVVAEEKEKIFERGFGKNTGLGLALSREILEITGITIKECGEPGKGARFEMTVPKGAWK